MTTKPKKRQLRRRTQWIIALSSAIAFSILANQIGLGPLSGGVIGAGMVALLSVGVATWILNGQPEPEPTLPS